MADQTLSEEYLTKSFSQFALARGWPDEIVSQIQVTFDGNEFKLEYPENLDNQIFELEYGDIGKFAQPAIRNWTASLKEPVTVYRAEALFSDLAKDGLF